MPTVLHGFNMVQYNNEFSFCTIYYFKPNNYDSVRRYDLLCIFSSILSICQYHSEGLIIDTITALLSGTGIVDHEIVYSYHFTNVQAKPSIALLQFLLMRNTNF